MYKFLLFAVLALALPTALFAGSSVDYTSSGGTLSGSSARLSLSGSVLLAVNGRNYGGRNDARLLTDSDLGNARLTMGALTRRSTISIGETSANANAVVAEPGSLTLLGTALIGLAGLVRRKLNR